MAFDPTELMSPRDRLAYNINMRGRTGTPSGPPDGSFRAAESDFFGADGLGFDDLLDIVNPLQHLPFVATAYRALTGDELSAGARVIGGGLYGGPAGMFSGAIDAAVAEANGGKDAGAIAVAAMTGEDAAPRTPAAKPEVAVAAAELDAVQPAAGEPKRMAQARPWRDPDAPGAERALAPGPSVSQETLPYLPSAIREAKPAAGPDPAKMADNIPKLSEQQVALLLNSVGVKPAEDAKPAREPAAGPDDLEADRSLEALDLGRETAGVATTPTLRRNKVALGPMKQIYVRQPVGSKAWASQSFTPNYKTPASHEAAAAGGGDQAWVAGAMASALDKYRNSGNKAAGNAKGSTIDDSY